MGGPLCDMQGWVGEPIMGTTQIVLDSGFLITGGPSFEQLGYLRNVLLGAAMSPILNCRWQSTLALH
jgi:hypothetical protein